jgi:hypothetical protein
MKEMKTERLPSIVGDAHLVGRFLQRWMDMDKIVQLLPKPVRYNTS